MPPDPHDYGPERRTSFVVLGRADPGYRVTVEPPPARDPPPPLEFADKHSAWGAARELWTAMRLPFRDETDLRVGTANAARDHAE